MRSFSTLDSPEGDEPTTLSMFRRLKSTLSSMSVASEGAEAPVSRQQQSAKAAARPVLEELKQTEADYVADLRVLAQASSVASNDVVVGMAEMLLERRSFLIRLLSHPALRQLMSEALAEERALALDAARRAATLALKLITNMSDHHLHTTVELALRPLALAPVRWVKSS